MPLEKMSSDPTKLDTSDSMKLSPEYLRVGMYVDLNCSWFRHPFPRRSFKLTSQSQINTIKGLGLGTVLVYPRESDPETDGKGTPIETAAVQPQAQEPAAEPHHEEAETEQPIQPADREQPTQGDYHQSAQMASEAYREMLGASSKMMKELSNGSAEGIRCAESMTGGLNTLLANTEAAGTVATAFDPEAVENASVIRAMNVATLSMLVAQQFNIDQETLQMIGMAGLLLDIGEHRIPKHILQTRARRSEVENVKYQLHPYLGVEMLRKFPHIPEEVLDVIRSHHERLDGSGYPEKLKGDQISLPTRIVSAVDHYDSLVNSLYPEEALSPAEALSTMYKYQSQMFAADVLVAMIQTLGVYPPGTVLSLSDGRFAQVLNINFKYRLKPLVLLYDEDGPPGDPVTADLQSQPELTILRGMRRGELPRKVVEYFQLKRWTGYFIQSSIRAA